ncbi:hypothetical protein O6P43_033122 [Quillaja saponaria]|uniref:Uncharacterized protein n=1 Tax=Quillaja saponaria TaxID=32244 RepID=A0AAD7KQ38_QUISA|nr:hypothetical protein O6P43_033122 [Quillaja saponaria]
MLTSFFAVLIMVVAAQYGGDVPDSSSNMPGMVMAPSPNGSGSNLTFTSMIIRLVGFVLTILAVSQRI